MAARSRSETARMSPAVRRDCGCACDCGRRCSGGGQAPLRGAGHGCYNPISAWSRSSIRSSVASIPTDSRIRPSEIPRRWRSSRSMPECEVVAGRVINVSTPPKLDAARGTAQSPACFHFEIGHEGRESSCRDGARKPHVDRANHPVDPADA